MISSSTATILAGPYRDNTNIAITPDPTSSKLQYANFKRDLRFEDTKFTFPTQDFFKSSVTNKGQKGNWDWWFKLIHLDDNSKSLMKAYNVVYTCTLKIGELTYSYVGKVEQVKGWKHRMMGSLRGQSNCWVFCKALRVFPPSLWVKQVIDEYQPDN